MLHSMIDVVAIPPKLHSINCTHTSIHPTTMIIFHCNRIICPIAVAVVVVVVSAVIATPIFAISIGGVSYATTTTVVVGVPAAAAVWSTTATILSLLVAASRSTIVAAVNETTTSIVTDIAVVVGACSTDEECTAIVRSRYPTQQSSSTGVGLCDCYSSSSIFPFDECEGQEDGCLVARCMNGCAGLEGYCLFANATDNSSASTTNGTCHLRQIIESITTSSVAVATNETVAVGMCTADEECTAVVRSQFPLESSAGVDLCDCYSASSTSPFDECEGQDTDCLMAKCMDSCAGLDGYCMLPADSNDGTCSLRNTTSSVTNETVVVGMCTNDEECTAMVRSQSPTQSKEGVDLCDCYASSSTSPFDECEGQEMDCMMAKCMDSCAGFEGYCMLPADSNDGTCDLRQVTAQSNSPTPVDSLNATSSLDEAVGTCTSDDECTAVVRSHSPPQSSEGVAVCDCYSASSTFPFDECEGQDTDCLMAKCMDSCAGYEGYCLLSPDSADGTQSCVLRQVSTTISPVPPGSPPTSPSPTVISAIADETVGSCTSDDECTAVVRSRFPAESNAGVELCECYAASSTSPFDECEGESDETCAIAKCMNSCDGMEAYCRLSTESTDGMCTLQQANNSSAVSADSPSTSPSSNVTLSTADVKEADVSLEKSSSSGSTVKYSLFILQLAIAISSLYYCSIV